MNRTVCLVSPPSRSFNHFRPPLALIYLAGYLEKNGIKTEVVDIALENQLRNNNLQFQKENIINQIQKKIINKIKAIRPFIVGITSYSPEYYEVLNLAKQIKKINKNIFIVVGGVHPTLNPKDFIFEKSAIDFAVLGEGEITLADLVRNIENRKKWPKIKSIAYFDRISNKVIITSPRPLCRNLDDLAFPAYHKINMEYYTSANPYAIRGVFSRSAYLLSSRGCPSSCTFCVSKKLRGLCGSGGVTRLRSPLSLLNEISFLKDNYQIDSFYFIDDLFTLNRENVKEFCEALISSKTNLIWGCSSKVTTVNFDILKKMRDAGCVQIDFGVERGSDKALLLIKKGITIKKIKEVFADCHILGIRSFANMLVNLPGEEESDLQDITNLLTEIKPDIVSLNVFTPYPGTEIFDVSQRKITKKDYPNMMKNPCDLIREEPAKYKFSRYNIDLGDWVSKNSKKYNRVLPSLIFYLSPRYLGHIIKSQKKMNYFNMAGLVFREFFYQKYGL